MINYLVALLDRHSTSFCCYENPAYHHDKSEPMPQNELERVVDYAARNKISVNFIYANHRPPRAHEALIESVEHVKIMPLDLRKEIEEGIFVINQGDRELIDNIEENGHLILILRLEREALPDLAGIFQSLSGKFKRLNLCLLDIENYREDDLKEYEKQLSEIEKLAKEEYRAGKAMEIGFISDRMMLQNMNNCDAGLKHLTVAPNGRLYLCPGFYYDEEESSIGTLQEEIEIKNSQLLTLNHAPICRNCDAYHCKRCIYLNKKTTLELNTPSHQQCVVSHLERNTAMRLLKALEPSVEMFKTFVPIPRIPYLDPFEIRDDITNQAIDPETGERSIAALLAKPLEKLSTRELLYQVYKVDKDLLIKLKNLNQGE